jgi:hypothetical protein
MPIPSPETLGCQCLSLAPRVAASSSAGGEQQSVATAQAARGWTHPPCGHFKNQSCYCLVPAFEVAAFQSRAQAHLAAVDSDTQALRGGLVQRVDAVTPRGAGCFDLVLVLLLLLLGSVRRILGRFRRLPEHLHIHTVAPSPMALGCEQGCG